MRKYILGVPAKTGNSDVITNYKVASNLEGLFVYISTADTVALATSSSVVIGVAQKSSNGSCSVARNGLEIPVALDSGAGSSLAGKPVYMTSDGKATDVSTDNTLTPFHFSAHQPSANEVVAQDGTATAGALIDIM